MCVLCVLVCRLSHILQHQIIFDLLGAQHTLHFQVITNIEELWNPKRRSSSITHPPYTSSSSVTRFMLSFCAAQTHTDNSNNNNEQALIIMIWSENEKKERKYAIICNNMMWTREWEYIQYVILGVLLMTIFTLVFSLSSSFSLFGYIKTCYKSVICGGISTTHTHTSAKKQIEAFHRVPLYVCAVHVTSKAIIVEIAITISIMLFHHYYSFFSCSLSLSSCCDVSFPFVYCIQRSFVCSVSFLVFPLVPCAFFQH